MKIGLFGCGAYGIALSSIMASNGCDITMWTRFEKEKELMQLNRGNDKAIPGYRIDDSIKITTDLEETIKDKDLLVVAIPAAFVDDLAKDMAPYIKDNHIVIATKGIEQDTGLFVNQILEKYLDTKNIAAISGPSFAVDLVTKMPAGLSVASRNEYTIELAKKAFQNKYIKLRETDDIIGVEICGAIKNVIALSSGMLEGMGALESTKAMLITEAVHDMEEILDSFNARKRTVTSFAGLGDLLLTCTSTKSRNYSFGKLLGSGCTKEEKEEYLQNTTVEGYYTLESIYKLLKDREVSIPIIDLIYDIAVNGEDPHLLLSFLVEK